MELRIYMLSDGYLGLFICSLGFDFNMAHIVRNRDMYALPESIFCHGFICRSRNHRANLHWFPYKSLPQPYAHHILNHNLTLDLAPWVHWNRGHPLTMHFELFKSQYQHTFLHPNSTIPSKLDVLEWMDIELSYPYTGNTLEALFSLGEQEMWQGIFHRSWCHLRIFFECPVLGLHNRNLFASYLQMEYRLLQWNRYMDLLTQWAGSQRIYLSWPNNHSVVLMIRENMAQAPCWMEWWPDTSETIW